MERNITHIQTWIEENKFKDIESFVSELGNTFGLITMKDGRKAQVKVSLELDKDCWD